MSLDEFRRSQIQWVNPLRVGAETWDARDILERLGPLLTPERRERIGQVVALRTKHFVPVVEGIFDLGNISAVMRSAEAFGFISFNLISKPGSKFKAANRITRGAHKWLDVRIDHDARESVAHLQKMGYQVLATHLDAAVPIGEVDFTRPTAVVFGNEREGVSPELLSVVDGRMKIPMYGFSQSFNISVAAALTLYHVRQALEAVESKHRFLLSKAEQELVMAQYFLRGLDNPEATLRKLSTGLNQEVSYE